MASESVAGLSLLSPMREAAARRALPPTPMSTTTAAEDPAAPTAAALPEGAAAAAARTALFPAPPGGPRAEPVAVAADDEVIDLCSSPPPPPPSRKVKREAPPSASAGRSADDAILLLDDASPPRAPRPKTEAAAQRVKTEAAAQRVKTEAAAADRGSSGPPAPPLSRRQKRSAFVNAAPGVPRPIVRLGLRVDGALGQTVDLGSGLRVQFPFAQALMTGKHALLEAPTGTGKTLALLVAALGYQHAVAQLGVPEDVPVVFFVARTLNQLDQTARECRRTAYRPLMTLLAGRGSLCQLPAALKPGADRAHECEKATFKHDITCAHLKVQENIGWPAAPHHLRHFLPGGALETADIEDLVKLGTTAPPPGASRPGVCPYHTSRDLLPEGAGLVLVTYQQLLNPTICSANGLNLLRDKAIIIWDEAHNVPAAAREAATLLRDAVGLRVLGEGLAAMSKALEEASDAVVPDKKAHLATLAKLRQIASRLLGWLLQQVKPEANGEWKADTTQGDDGVQAWTRHGAAARNLATRVLELSAASLAGLRLQVRQMRAALIAADFESSAVKSTAINDINEICCVLEMLLNAKDPGDYRLVVRRQDTASRRRAAAAGREPPLPSVLFACMLGGVAMEPLREAARCMLFAFGTLGPDILLSSELQLGDNCVCVSTEHHATIAAQLRLLVINNGRDVHGASRLLEMTYRNRTDEMYECIGTTLLTLLKHIPGGCLVFWPSQSMMLDARERWEDCGIMHALGALVPVIEVDGPRLSAEQSKQAMERYRKAAAASRTTSCGALLLAVMRGRASEGTDFSNEAARGVIVVGLPLPPWNDAAVINKKSYNDSRWPATDPTGSPDPRCGEAWYLNEGVRCAAQAIGRVIRHAGDYGTAILLDCRYGTDAGTRFNKGVRTLLPLYARKLIRGDAVAVDADAAAAVLQPFFAERRALAGAPVTPPVKLED